MSIRIGAEQVVLFGFGGYLLRSLKTMLRPGSVVVVEEPDAIRKRGLARALDEYPMVSRIVPWEYLLRDDPSELLAAEPGLRGARAVVPGIEYGVTAAARFAEQLGLPGAGTVAGRAFRDKYLLRELAGSAGLRNPRYQRVGSRGEVAEFLREAGGRCVVKPTSRQASMGVQILDDPGQIPAAWEAAVESVDEDGPDRGVPSAVLVEEAVAGPEYSVEMLVSGGSCRFANVTAKQVMPGWYPVELGHIVPAGAPADLIDRLLEATSTLAAAARFGDGILHAEWIAGAGEPTLVECAARIPGGQITQLITLAYGFPLLEAYFDVLLGGASVWPPHSNGAAAIRFLTGEAGEVIAVEGAERAAALPGVVEVEITVSPGDRVGGTRSSWDRFGHVLAQATSSAAAGATAAAAAASVRIATR